MQNVVEDSLRAAKAAVSAPAGGTAGYTGSLASVQQYLAPSADVEGLLAESKASQEQAATQNKDTLLQGIGKSYETGMQNVNTAAGEAQRQNYISHQMQQKNIGQQLAAAGLTGGAAESTLLGLSTAYGENRRLTEADRLKQAAALEAERAQQETAAQTDYNTLMAGIANDYAQQLAAAKQAETDRQAQLLLQKFAADQSAAQAEANRAWQQQQAEAERAWQQAQNEYNWQQQFAMADKDLAAQLQLAAAKSTSGSSTVDPNNWYSKLGVPYEQMGSFQNALNGVADGSIDKNVLRKEAAGVIAQFGATAYEYLYQNAKDVGYVKQATNPTADLIGNALAAAAQNQMVQNAAAKATTSTATSGGRKIDNQTAAKK